MSVALPPGPQGPRVPPAPAGGGVGRRRGDGRWAIWLGMFVIGALSGAATHRLVPDIGPPFDSWVARTFR